MNYRVLELAEAELESAIQKFPAMRSIHEGYAILKEEVDELWDEIKGQQRHEELMAEAIQVAAMALRFVHDLAPVSLLYKRGENDQGAD